MLKTKIINTVAFAAMISVNLLANIIPIGGNTTAEVSEKYSNLFTPAPLTFAIWGVIYIMLAAFIIYQMNLSKRSDYAEEIGEKTRNWFVISCILNIAWILTWHFNLTGLSVIMIVGMLFSLIMIMKKINNSQYSLAGRVFVKAGFEIYLGWILAASIANICVFAVRAGIKGTGSFASVCTALLLIAGALLGSYISVHYKSLLSLAAISWAYIGIIIRHLSASGFKGSYPVVYITAICSIVFMIITCIYASIKQKENSRNFVVMN